MSKDDEILDALDNLCWDDRHTKLTVEQQRVYDGFTSEFLDKEFKDAYPEE